MWTPDDHADEVLHQIVVTKCEAHCLSLGCLRRKESMHVWHCSQGNFCDSYVAMSWILTLTPNNKTKSETIRRYHLFRFLSHRLVHVPSLYPESSSDLSCIHVATKFLYSD